MSELLFIGTGGSVATEERDNTSFLFLSQDAVAMIDCPGSVVHKLKKIQIDPRSVRSIIVTHIHPDHIYGLPSLIHSLMLDDCVIEILGSPEGGLMIYAGVAEDVPIRNIEALCRSLEVHQTIRQRGN